MLKSSCREYLSSYSLKLSWNHRKGTSYFHLVYDHQNIHSTFRAWHFRMKGLLAGTAIFFHGIYYINLETRIQLNLQPIYLFESFWKVELVPDIFIEAFFQPRLEGMRKGEEHLNLLLHHAEVRRLTFS